MASDGVLCGGFNHHQGMTGRVYRLPITLRERARKTIRSGKAERDMARAARLKKHQFVASKTTDRPALAFPVVDDRWAAVRAAGATLIGLIFKNKYIRYTY
ncbi:hypothetical protein QBD00_003376 [Ochrobactrum sp. AN78]|nr:hypothetical protein [Ochrobactrum sp. AN78]